MTIAAPMPVNATPANGASAVAVTGVAAALAALSADNSGSAQDATTDPSASFAQVLSTLAAAQAPRYQNPPAAPSSAGAKRGQPGTKQQDASDDDQTLAPNGSGSPADASAAAAALIAAAAASLGLNAAPSQTPASGAGDEASVGGASATAGAPSGAAAPLTVAPPATDAGAATGAAAAGSQAAVDANASAMLAAADDAGCASARRRQSGAGSGHDAGEHAPDEHDTGEHDTGERGAGEHGAVSPVGQYPDLRPDDDRHPAARPCIGPED
jgi:hypothetical protein